MDLDRFGEDPSPVAKAAVLLFALMALGLAITVLSMA